MAWRIEFERAAARELEELGSQAAERVLRFLRDRVASLDDARSIGQALKGGRFDAFTLLSSGVAIEGGSPHLGARSP
jgi:mRNA interferase RelE/StbE